MALDDLTGQAYGFMRQHLAERSTSAGLKLQASNNQENDPTLLCQPYGFVREAVNPLPMKVIRQGDNLIFDYEEWNLERTIHMKESSIPEGIAHSALGYSIGHMEGSTLVIETARVSSDIYFFFQTGGAYTDQLTGVERYALSGDDLSILSVELAVEDPLTLLLHLYLLKLGFLHRS